MCNLYAQTSSQDEIRAIAEILNDHTGNLPLMPDIYPDYAAPIVRNGQNGREMVLARWGMPSPAFALKGRKVDRGVTNIRNTASPHWRRWLGLSHRCVVPFTAFSEQARQDDGSFHPVWFAADATKPLRFFAGIWTSWTSVRKLKEGEVAPYHPKAMPVILEDREEIETWLTAPTLDALKLQRPLQESSLQVL
ncbi:SOS response-associated peptidase family protein [Gluconobacter sp. NFX36]|uniref:SOS response-associated peptidase n=1 Tax=Gluconobacter sp. NFX36 TaxID=2819535 RepID=UPI003CF26519